MAWTWIAAAFVLLIILAAALVVRWLILPYTDPELYRLVTDKRDSLTGRSPASFKDPESA